MGVPVAFAESFHTNLCLQDCIIVLASGRWRRRLRRMLGLVGRNDSRRGLGGDAEECLNFTLTEAALTLSHFKILVVEASTKEDLCLGRCAGVWTLGPDNGIVLGQIA